MTSIAQDIGTAALVALVIAFGSLYVVERARRRFLAAVNDQDERGTSRRPFIASVEVKHRHEIGPNTVGLLGELLDRGIKDYFDRKADAPTGPMASKTVMPPEPEERMARDLAKAHAIVRGAERLQEAARQQGKYLPPRDAMQQAAAMAANAFDNTN